MLSEKHVMKEDVILKLTQVNEQISFCGLPKSDDMGFNRLFRLGKSLWGLCNPINLYA